MSKRTWIIGLAGIVALAGVAYASFKPTTTASDVITVGSVTSDAITWKHIASSPEAKVAGLKIKVKTFTDGVQLNTATATGEVDVNAFQSYAYFAEFNAKNKQQPLVALGTTYIEPFGFYSKTIKNVADVPDGATVALPSSADDAAGQARALLLLSTKGLVTLADDFTSTSTIKQIKSNPKHLVFKEIEQGSLPRVYKDGSADLVGIQNSTATDAGLNVLTDSLFHEQLNKTTQPNVNILATAAKNKNNKDYAKLVTLFHNKKIQAWLKEKYPTKTEIKEPVAELAAATK
ncbi:MAG TPA: MetQ/NlpA family ABC transporter substrate-binding protein [Lactobacillaceae bacterium]|jgi:D-methionine transport system substrate-binding protein